MPKINNTKFRRGAVSLYVVIFTTLLLSVITISFMRIMLNEQQQSTDTELAQSAYDSSLAGTENAKVALLKYQDCVTSGDTSTVCETITKAIVDQTCDTIPEALGIGVSGEETVLSQGSGDGVSEQYNQAYSCVKVQLDTEDFLGQLQPGKSKLVPLKFKSEVSQLEISWFVRSNSSNNNLNLEAGVANGQSLLYKVGAWPSNRPSVLRTQLIQAGVNGFQMSQLDSKSGGETNRGTLFLYPTNNGTTAISAATVADSSTRAQGVVAPSIVKCEARFDSTVYACSVIVNLPSAIGGGRNSDLSFLRLSAYYNVTDYKIRGINTAGDTVLFDGVQPAIDSTGRANDLYRRTVSRVELTDVNYPYPEFAVEVGGDDSEPFCKEFLVTDNPAQAQVGTSCR